ncbi:MAG TPA: HIT domain-containing protein [Candidatus Saccharimonadales bacterium]|nr:HIT domain-containing protein [Candidatus Saccharimonadales bacterium]
MLVVPNKHYENIYVIPDEEISEVYKVVKKMAIAIRNAYDCRGLQLASITNRQAAKMCGISMCMYIRRYDEDKLYQNHDKRALWTPRREHHTPRS